MTQPGHDAAMQLKEVLTSQGVEHEWLSGRNDSLITRIRNEMTGQALSTKYKFMMWIDADIDYQPVDVQKLYELQTDIAVAAYSMKRPDKPLSAWKDGKLIKLDELGDKPIPVDCAGTGFMMIKMDAVRRVAKYLEDVEEKCRDLVKRSKNAIKATDEEAALFSRMLEGVQAEYHGNIHRQPALYMTPIHDDGMESEDYYFCRLAREAGMQIILDPTIRIGHWGFYRYA